MKHLSILGSTTTILLLCLVPVSAQMIWNSSSEDRAFLGVTTDEVSERKAELLGFENRHGAYITSIVNGSAAEEFGLQPLDYIVAVNDESMDWSTDLTELLENYEPGDAVTIYFYRKGKKQSKQVTLGRRRSSWKTNFNLARFNGRNDPFLGISQHEATSGYALGVRVNIIDSSTADELGMKDGDVIQSINDYTMIDWQDIQGAIKMMEPGDQVLVTWEREGQQYVKSGTIKSESDRRNNYSLSFGRAARGSDYAFLGIYSSPISREKAEKLGFDNRHGSYVTGVMDRSAASEIGLQPFDYIVGIDEYRTGKNQDLTDILRKYDIGESATLHFIRRGQKMTRNVTFTDRDDARDARRKRCDDPFLGVQQSFSTNPKTGVVINVIDESTADKAGMEDGDIITNINGSTILDWEDLGTAVDAMEIGAEIELDFLRDGKRQTGRAPIQSDCDRQGRSNRAINLDFRDMTINLFGDTGDREEEREAVSNMQADLQQMSTSDVNRLRSEFDLDIPNSNNLNVRGLQLYPKPETNRFGLEFELSRTGDTSVRIYNDSGREIYQYDLGGFIGEFSDDVDIAQNGEGSYFLVVQQRGQAFAKKIVLKRS